MPCLDFVQTKIKWLTFLSLEDKFNGISFEKVLFKRWSQEVCGDVCANVNGMCYSYSDLAVLHWPWNKTFLISLETIFIKKKKKVSVNKNENVLPLFFLFVYYTEKCEH